MRRLEKNIFPVLVGAAFASSLNLKALEPTTDIIKDAWHLSGSWDSGCVDIEAFDLEKLKVGSVRREVEFYPNKSYLSKEIYYFKPGCKDQAIEYRVVGKIDNIDKIDNSKMKAIDITINEQYLKPKNEGLCTAMRLVSSCGINDWIAGKEERIDGKNCAFMKTNISPVRDVFEVHEDSLRLGRGTQLNSKLSSDARPDKLNEEIEYHRHSIF